VLSDQPTNPLHKVLVANRGEIAVRVIRAAREAGIASVAVYAEPDAEAPHVRLADEAVALGGDTAAQSYLNIDAVLAAVRSSGADAVHPGYGFLSENADFAQAVLDAGCTWIGPSPQAIRELGDKVTARGIARSVDAPLVAGTAEPVREPAEIVAFAEEHGLPVLIKAAHGGGGRGMKVARTTAEIPELFASATREAEAAFGRGECFVERYLDRSRHVEAQVLADGHGTVVVVGTRDCTLQRRHQKLVEEAPAPFLSDAQRDAIHTSAKAICRAAGYSGAGTVEYLVGEDGTISFLEVNTRLQVEHPVTEETSGVDLVQEQFRIAAGARLRSAQDPQAHGHSFEFRINGEDAGRGFLPAPGTVTAYREPKGPGIRVDSGIEKGSVVGSRFDSMMAKLIVTGTDRADALERSRQALADMVVDGLATLLPFHRAVVDDPAFVGDEHGFAVHTRWVETAFDNRIAPFGEADAVPGGPDLPDDVLVVQVGGRPLQVRVPGLAVLGERATTIREQSAAAYVEKAGAATGNTVTAPMQGTIIAIDVRDGQPIESGGRVAVLEAMKMENPVLAHRSGTVAGVAVAVGDSVAHGSVLCEIVDA
jgi:acetyl-CoA/propionyl-CoA carboxylase, biotin carboxylase, biotin carboxyl carrier protein